MEKEATQTEDKLKEGEDFNYDITGPKGTRRGRCLGSPEEPSCDCKLYQKPPTGFKCNLCDHKPTYHENVDAPKQNQNTTNQGKNSSF